MQRSNVPMRVITISILPAAAKANQDAVHADTIRLADRLVGAPIMTHRAGLEFASGHQEHLGDLIVHEGVRRVPG